MYRPVPDDTRTEPSFLSEMWRQAARNGEESIWRFLPDEALDEMKRRNGTSDVDLEFLALQAMRHPAPAIAAVRLLALIGEAALAPCHNVRQLLLDAFKHEHSSVRVSIVEAFWQMADIKAKHELQSALNREAHPEVRATLEHVIQLFE